MGRSSSVNRGAMVKKRINVTGAVLTDGDKVLAARRGQVKRFPASGSSRAGKLKPEKPPKSHSLENWRRSFSARRPSVHTSPPLNTSMTSASSFFRHTSASSSREIRSSQSTRKSDGYRLLSCTHLNGPQPTSLRSRSLPNSSANETIEHHARSRHRFRIP